MTTRTAGRSRRGGQFAALAGAAVVLVLSGSMLIQASDDRPTGLVQNDQLGKESAAPDDRGQLTIVIVDDRGVGLAHTDYDVLVAGRTVLTMAPHSTDANGRASLRLPDGSYEVVATRDGRTGRAVVTVRKGQAAEARVTLR